VLVTHHEVEHQLVHHTVVQLTLHGRHPRPVAAMALLHQLDAHRLMRHALQLLQHPPRGEGAAPGRVTLQLRHRGGAEYGIAAHAWSSSTPASASVANVSAAGRQPGS